MNGRKVLLSISGVVLAAAAVWGYAAQSGAPAKTTNEHQAPNWQRVDQSARNIKAGDEAAVRTLIKEVLAENGIGENIVAASGSVPDRLVAAEIAYHKGKRASITEDSVVNAVNQLAQRFNAPAWAYTDLKELRRLRLKMFTVYPGLIGRGSAATRDDFHPHFERNLSPVEAFHVTATLIFQKIANPEFQFSRKEIEGASQKDKAGTSELTQKVANGERTQEILGVIRQTSASMSLRDVLNQSEQTLDRLGVPR